TNGVHDTSGKPIKPAEVDDSAVGRERGRDISEYHRDVRDAILAYRGSANKVVAATLFTTQSISADLSKIARQIAQSNPAPVNFVGHGGGPLGTLAVLRPAVPPVIVNAGGRVIDQDGNGSIDSTEGSSAAVPRTVIGSRDGLRQTVVDIMQLVREIQVGVD